MPTLKKSSSLPLIYSGQGAKQLLYDSLNFLFICKGKDFQKLNPVFVIPTVDEFLSYTLTCVNKTKKRNTSLHQFLIYISASMNIEKSLLRCIYVVQFALATYVITDYFLLGSDTITSIWLDAFCWFSTNYLSSYKISRELTSNTIQKYNQIIFFENLIFFEKEYNTVETDALSIGDFVINQCEKLNSKKVYDTLVLIPIVVKWCKEEKNAFKTWIIEKVYEYIHVN